MGGSEIYNFEDCVVTANERTGIKIDPDGIESGEAEVQRNEGDFQANFVVGITGRAPSERRSSFVTKVIHENLPTEARIAMWGGMYGLGICAVRMR